jgi:hypothetical protein
LLGFPGPPAASDNQGMNEKSKVAEREYCLYYTFVSTALPLICLVALSVVTLLLISLSPWNVEMLPLGIIFSAVAARGWFHASLMTYRIVADEATGDIQFIGLLTKRRVHATQIISIKPDQVYRGRLVVALGWGRPVMLQTTQFDGFHEFLTWLKRINPNVELRGC